ncbi:MAG: DUF4093 domain-containing protein [Clostridia bacterium]|nr:DUF4093 domain-containing protein [Clostridia bacterium]
MLRTDKVIVVEGKYDKIRLENIIDATIIPTDGFGIFKNKELQQLLRSLAATKGLIVLTDSDSAGFMIRSFLAGCIDNDKITNIYIPELFGKEKRKNAPSAEGLLGVEGIPDEIIAKAFAAAGIGTAKTESPARKVSKSDLYELGFSGGAKSSEKRAMLLEKLSLPKTTSRSLNISERMMPP